MLYIFFSLYPTSHSHFSFHLNEIVDFLQSVYGFDVANDVDLFPFDFVDVLQTCCLLARQMYKNSPQLSRYGHDMSTILLYLFRKIFVIWIHFSACCIFIVLMKMRNSTLFSLSRHICGIYVLAHPSELGKWKIPLCAVACSVLGVQNCKHSWSLFIMFEGIHNVHPIHKDTHSFTHTLYSFDYQCGNWGIPFSLFKPCVCMLVCMLVCLSTVLISLRHAMPNHSHYTSDSTAMVCSFFFVMLMKHNGTDWKARFIFLMVWKHWQMVLFTRKDTGLW